MSMPRIVAAGPLLSTLDHWLNLPAERQFIHLHDESNARNGVRYLAAAGSKAVKVWYIVRPPDLPVEASAAAVNAAGDEARKLKLPFIVHATGLAEAKQALRAGANVLVHSVEDVAVDPEFIELAKRNATIVIPTLTVLDGYVRMYHGVAARKAPPIDDPNGCVDAATRAKVAETATIDATLLPADRISARDLRAERFRRNTRANLKALAAAGVPIATGTDAGNPLTLHGPAIYAEMEAMQSSGMSPMQVLVASTATAARAARVDGETGTIEKGKSADILLTGGDPASDVANLRNVRYVMRGGVLRPIEDLSAMAK
jgi:imidazolonepropionase-like amidohydrolase